MFVCASSFQSLRVWRIWVGLEGQDFVAAGGRQENGDTWKHKDLMTEVVRRSNLLCLQLYEKDGIGVSSTILATSLLARFHSYQSSVSLAEVCS